ARARAPVEARPPGRPPPVRLRGGPCRSLALRLRAGQRPAAVPARREPARRARAVIAAVAAGHPATAEAGAEILADGGGAVDAAVAACLASCVAETVMTGLLGGGPAIGFDAATRRTRHPDSFGAVPA